MITLVSGTNRADSNTIKVARHYETLLKQHGAAVTLLNLEGRKVWERGEDMLKIEAECLIPAEKFIFIMPEYNGSFPGILKTMFDNSDIRKCYWGKMALLTGLADGRGGNLRGIEHMTNILHYLRVNVHWNKLPLSRINEEMDKNGVFHQQTTLQAIEQQVVDFIAY